MEKFNSSMNNDKKIQENTVEGLERLGGSLATMKTEMMADHDEKLTDLDNKVAQLSVKHLTFEQQITRYVKMSE